MAFFGVGTLAQAQSGNVTPGLPTSFATNDIHVCVVSAADNVVCTFPSGWTTVIALNNGTTERLTVAWKRAVGGDTNPLVTHAAGNDIAAQIAGYSGRLTSGDPIGTAVGSQANASSVTITAPAITTISANSDVLFIGTIIDAGNLLTVSGYSGTNPTFTERLDGGASGGSNNVEICVADGVKTNVSTTGSRTATATGANANIGALLALQIAAAEVTIPRLLLPPIQAM